MYLSCYVEEKSVNGSIFVVLIYINTLSILPMFETAILMTNCNVIKVHVDKYILHVSTLTLTPYVSIQQINRQ